ncbi:DnaA regulatory inactivator Hda [Pseudidiomarina sp.]|uniref:DnaA regulatory inactivator Hda n=1 Tax=Pseudidiomarina sp. TaxID=2081707 RepID=UPI00299ECC3B|nr:DnaA regulatory inactivator Hda [Pseudidiomarina sp.]MDX1705702.1 DnaA regulatory inactivator Hda [Pseudidiomarina sp.]
MSSPQLPLELQLPDDQTFATFVVGDNREIANILRQTRQPFVYLWGSAGVGKSHLLYALCAAEQGTVIYLPMAELAAMQPEMLRGIEVYDLICIDDIDAVTDNEAWCFELFALFNRIHDAGRGQMIVTAAGSAVHIDVAVADLRSRLQWGVSFHLKPLSDTDKARALQRRARTLGLVLRDDTAQFMVQRLGRDLGELMQCLAQLDRASITEQRRLTTPFVKRILGI